MLSVVVEHCGQATADAYMLRCWLPMGRRYFGRANADQSEAGVVGGPGGALTNDLPTPYFRVHPVEWVEVFSGARFLPQCHTIDGSFHCRQEIAFSLISLNRVGVSNIDAEVRNADFSHRFLSSSFNNRYTVPKTP